MRVLSALFLLLAAAPSARAGDGDLPPFDKVSEGYEAVTPAGGESGFYKLWRRSKDDALLAELPAGYDGQRFTLIATVAGGSPETGVYSIWHSSVGVPATVLHWERRGDRLALIEPNLTYITSGDQQSKDALERIYTGRVLLSTPVLAKGPGGGPVIDLDKVLLSSASTFFGGFTRGADTSLARVTTLKAFPRNVEVGFELPRAGGRLASLRYSIALPVKDADFVPREADRRVGIYYNDYVDRARHTGDPQTVRYANRWHLQKADPSLAMSPPKRPIEYHIEHTTPVRYRRWVRDGILSWNKAFEAVGLSDAIVVHQQDAATGAYMDRDPEDSRWSFVRWTNSQMGFAIGPVHVHPETGQIYEADIVMDEGFLSSYASAHLQTELAATSMATLHPELAPWLAEHPEWDPRWLLADPADRPAVERGTRALADGLPLDLADLPPTLAPGVWQPHAEAAGAGPWSCRIQPGLAASVATMRLALELDGDDAGDGEDDGPRESLLDGLPESFVGPMLRDVVMHEVGHTLGLMHNWKGSALYDIAEMNSADFAGSRSIQSTVMDYAPINLVVEDDGLVQGDWCPIDIGPYDRWAIEWNYTFDDPAAVAARADEPGHAFMAEDGAFSPDPQAKTWDLGKDSLDHAEATMAFVHHARGRFLDEGLEDGDSWEKARRLYGMLLGKQAGALSEAAHWIGGAHITRHGKGGAGDPVVPVDPDQQRRALAFLIDNAFCSEAFGLDPAVLRKLGSDNWYDDGYADDHAWPVHERVLGVQASALSMLLNPTRLGRIMDNALRSDGDVEPLTVAEVLQAVGQAVWAPLDGDASPRTTSLERNLQSAHLGRLIDLALGMGWPGAAARDTEALARLELTELAERLEAASAGDLDRASAAHLADASERIARALEAAYTRRR